MQHPAESHPLKDAAPCSFLQRHVRPCRIVSSQRRSTLQNRFLSETCKALQNHILSKAYSALQRRLTTKAYSALQCSANAPISVTLMGKIIKRISGRSHLSSRGLSDQSRSPCSCQQGLAVPAASATLPGQTMLRQICFAGGQ